MEHKCEWRPVQFVNYRRDDLETLLAVCPLCWTYTELEVKRHGLPH